MEVFCKFASGDCILGEGPRFVTAANNDIGPACRCQRMDKFGQPKDLDEWLGSHDESVSVGDIREKTLDDGCCGADVVANNVVMFLPVVPWVGVIAVVSCVENLDGVAIIRFLIDSVHYEVV